MHTGEEITRDQGGNTLERGEGNNACAHLAPGVLSIPISQTVKPQNLQDNEQSRQKSLASVVGAGGRWAEGISPLRALLWINLTNHKSKTEEDQTISNSTISQNKAQKDT